jgi:hypothetical protein
MPRTKVNALIVRIENAICVPVRNARKKCAWVKIKTASPWRDGICGQSAHHGDS